MRSHRFGDLPWYDFIAMYGFWHFFRNLFGGSDGDHTHNMADDYMAYHAFHDTLGDDDVCDIGSPHSGTHIGHHIGMHNDFDDYGTFGMHDPLDDFDDF